MYKLTKKIINPVKNLKQNNTTVISAISASRTDGYRDKFSWLNAVGGQNINHSLKNKNKSKSLRLSHANSYLSCVIVRDEMLSLCQIYICFVFRFLLKMTFQFDSVDK